MKRESFIFAISGTLFGVLIGWILGSQSAAPAVSGTAAAAAAPATTAAAPAQTGAPTPSMQSGPQPQPVDQARVASLTQTATAQPQNADVRVELGNTYFDAQQYSQAVPWYEAALKLTPNDVDLSTDLGVCYYYTNQIDRAIAQLNASLAINPTHVKTLFNLGIVRAFGKEDLAGATEVWQKVVALAPQSDEGKKAQQILDGLKAHPNMGAGGGAAPGAGGA